jgi:hypothetical protein
LRDAPTAVGLRRAVEHSDRHRPVESARELDALPIQGFTGTPAEIERQWYERVYRGRGDSMLQLTWRAAGRRPNAG